MLHCLTWKFLPCCITITLHQVTGMRIRSHIGPQLIFDNLFFLILKDIPLIPLGVTDSPKLTDDARYAVNTPLFQRFEISPLLIHHDDKHWRMFS